MNKSVYALIGAAVAGGAALFFFADPRGISIAGKEFGGSERGWLADRTIDFVEDLQFKDFKKASQYHLPKAQKERDIPAMIQGAFRIKHEVLDIIDYKVLDVDLDRSKERARVRTLVNYRVLGDQVVKDDKEAHRNVELLFYWFRQPDGTWTMELSSSL